MLDDGYSIDEVDEFTGPAIGRPKSATFRTLDIVGIDTFVHVTKNIYQNAPADEHRELFKVPEFIEQMTQRKWLGDKTGQGFYKKVGKDILSLDPSTMEYGPRKKASYASLVMAKTIEDVAERFKSIIKETDRAGSFISKTLSEVLIYSANR